MGSDEYEILGIEQIVNDTDGKTSTTAQILLIRNGEPACVYVVPVYGYKEFKL